MLVNKTLFSKKSAKSPQIPQTSSLWMILYDTANWLLTKNKEEDEEEKKKKKLIDL